MPKKRLQTIKFPTELVFNTLLGFYISQLKERNTYLAATNSSTRVLKSDLPKLRIDQRKLATHKKEGVQRFSFCKKTARNHVKRLREAKVLINYTCANQNKPISVNFNPEIVAILDGKPPKRQFNENQFFKGGGWKVLPDNSDNNKVLKRNKKKDFLIFHKENECGLMQQQNVSLAESYKTTIRISNAKQTSPRENVATIRKILPDFLKTGAKSQNTNNTITVSFLAKLMEEKMLAQELSVGKYDNYKGLSYHYLQKVIQYADVTIEEFRSVLIQDFVKSSAKIWKDHQSVHVGSWKNAINSLNQTLFKGITQKETLLNKLKEYRWKLDFARKWFLKSKIPALYPSLYFDVHRKASSGIGFYGLHSIWKSHLKYQQNKIEKQKESQQQESARKRKIKMRQRFENTIKAYEKGKYTAAQVYNYVKDNLPQSYVSELTRRIEEIKKTA
ncbi:conserved hypothetical protein [Tenacibaculum amylolyticum]